MVSFRQLHSHLKLLSNNDLQGTRTESGFKRAFATLLGQDIETFTGTMFLNVDQLEKQLDKDEFQEIESMAAFKVLETQFQMFIKSWMYMDDEYVVMTRNYFLKYTQLEIPEFRDTLIQHMEFVKKSIGERAKHKQDSGTALKEQDTSNRSGNDAHADDTDIRPIYDEEPMAEVQTTAEINVFATGQQHTEQPEFNNEGEVDLNVKQCHDTCPLPANQRFSSQVDVNNDLSKPVTIHYLPKKRESTVAKPHRMIAPGSSRYSSNDMVHNHYLEEAKQKTQESSRNSEPINHVFKVPSHKTTTRYKPVEQTSFAKKPERQIPKRHRSSIKKTSVVYEKIMTPRSGSLSGNVGKIFKTVGLRWVPTGKIFTSSTTKVDSEPQNGSNADITNQYECEQTLDVSVGTINLSAGTSFNPKKEGIKVWLLKRQISQKLGLQRIPI
ncbi:hypothetical protein Tco_1273255 [Tanacetum coccineum]